MADNLTLALKVKADLDNAVRNFKLLEAEMQRTARAGNAVGRDSRSGAQGLNALGNSADQATGKLGKTRAGVESISKQLTVLKKQVVGLAALSRISVGLAGIANTSDEYKNYQARINLVSASNREAKGTFKELMQIADDTGQLFNATAELYTRSYRALGDKANSAELLQFTKTIQQATVVSGANAQEASAAIIQLSQGLASGTLRGEEFNSVSEQMPIILEILQKSLGKTRGELRKMAEQGELTPQLIIGAMKEAKDEIQRQYDAMPHTIGRAINELSNAWLRFIGQTDKAVPAVSLVASTVSALAKNLDELGTVLLIVAGAATGRYISSMAKMAIETVRNNTATAVGTRSLIARAQIEVNAAKAALAMAVATEREAIATERLALANRNLATAKAGATASGIGQSLLALAGGKLGLAITAITGLYLAYEYLKNREELDTQYQQTANSIQSNIDKTQGLIEARTKLGELGGFTDRVVQVDTNNKAIEDAKKQLDELIARRNELLNQNRTSVMGGLINADEINKVNEQIGSLEKHLKELGNIANIVKEQYKAAFDEAITAGGELAEKLKALGGPEVEEAQALLRDIIKKNESELQEMQGELKKLESKLNSDLVDATYTAAEKLERFRDRAIEAAKKAGDSGKLLQPLIDGLNNIIDLQNKVDNAKTAKDNQKKLESLRAQAEKSSLNARGQRDYDINHTDWESEEQRQQALKYSAQIEAGEKVRKAASKKKTEEYDASSKNLELNLQYLRLTGQQVKANLTDIEGRYSKLLAEFQKHSNVDGINLIKKILPLEKAKVQIDGVQAEINKLFQSQSTQEQRINTQVQTGLITHLEGQRQLKEIYAQTVAEIEKQLPLLEKLAQMPGTQGEQAKALLEQMRGKISELKNAGNDLEKAFKDGLTQGIQTSLVGLANGTMTLKDAIKNLATTILNAMAQIAAQQLALQASSAIGGLFGGAASSAAGSAVAAVGRATGGPIRGPGTSTSDSIPARLSDGEWVIQASAVSHYGHAFMDAINSKRLRKLATGGPVSVPAMPSYREPGLSDSLREGRAGSQVVASPVQIQQTLAVDSAELFTSGINTRAGEQAVLTVIRANKQTLKQDLS
ncbi:tape measure protein [Aggregatibacter actinomycetemcomitans]|uniref:tape measure protein n=1 Tax=Aggregatibacter actinomycetemcomitans TaxID=714 RepID=UPI0002ABFBAA|nr:tape measure protein [Aggregatibacter actinomycetemcomitans]KOE63934.1 tail protein [Aggregatibacter actinomycetemcomitans serotype e str. SCC393]KOE67374.1 tail protein [Aggregatibacter actinomycetemcomitans serotype e str. A160]KYK78375.1 tail protein [Aggregatibacter actinomycetemcomitans serotype e str. SA2876]